MTAISETDKTILNLIQLDFPIDARPFRVLAEKLDLTEEELIARIQAMKDLQVIRRIGGNFSPDRLGYYSTLCTAKVPEKKIDLFTRTVNMYAGVTHNYMRDHEFNIWFTFIAPSRDQIAESLEEISRQTGVSPILNLPATRVFKISANFKL
ncbi:MULTISPECIES: siroheme decarboxylase subunit alpha [Desulfotignum]|jgi:DNA-binding Lrp family transcriptional regulator|uniref:siroheme decarboxylase n=1 Tax=Desulfotignum phosphitoxidans DSM 13687 TaxID=1286635 RepID=S0FXA2_9BACT|nr:MULTISPECIES: AsnC family transcriptional regulator [Desulfotignum]EMS79360.1 heme d1 biosynthesis protein NirD [Desulfotignum phosphitoxidans DSM 13687]